MILTSKSVIMNILQHFAHVNRLVENRQTQNWQFKGILTLGVALIEFCRIFRRYLSRRFLPPRSIKKVKRNSRGDSRSPPGIGRNDLWEPWAVLEAEVRPPLDWTSTTPTTVTHKMTESPDPPFSGVSPTQHLH